MIRIRRWGVYIVDLNPRLGTKPGKQRPAVVIQPDELNEIGHPSTILLPISTKLPPKEAYPLRVRLPKGEAGLAENSVVLVDQFLAWDNQRFKSFLGMLSPEKAQELEKACRDLFGW